MSPSKFNKVLITILLVFLVGISAFAAWALSGPKASDAAWAAMKSDNEISVQVENGVVSFTKELIETKAGFIFYPGARVEPQAYARVLRAIANKGVAVFVVEMPLRMAVLNPDAAENIIQDHPEYTKWFIGGHSLGGVMAATYAKQHPEQISGLILWASYPAGSDDLSNSAMPVLSISGSRDGLSTPQKIQDSASLLPATTVWVTIEGGNHSQFGDYGLQDGDNPAKISAEEQHQSIVENSARFMLDLADKR